MHDYSTWELKPRRKKRIKDQKKRENSLPARASSLEIYCNPLSNLRVLSYTGHIC